MNTMEIMKERNDKGVVLCHFFLLFSSRSDSLNRLVIVQPECDHFNELRARCISKNNLSRPVLPIEHFKNLWWRPRYWEMTQKAAHRWAPIFKVLFKALQKLIVVCDIPPGLSRRRKAGCVGSWWTLTNFIDIGCKACVCWDEAQIHS